MSFQQGLSGLSASSKALDSVGNNIANSGTVGFKSANTAFADVFAATLGSGSQVGIGTSVAGINQQFTQGNITVTNNALDLAVNGQGFYRLDNNGSITWTRNGQFNVDKDGYIVNASGYRLTGFLANASNIIVPSTPAQIFINTADLQPQATGGSAGGAGLEIGLNLDSRESVIASAFSVNDPTSYNSSTSATVYDTLGNPHLLSLFFKKTGANAWNLYTNIDGGSSAAITAAAITGATAASVSAAVSAAAAASGTTADANAATAAAAAAALPGATAASVRDAANAACFAGPTALTFSTTGALTSPASGIINQSHGVISGAINPLGFALNLNGSTQFGSIFGVNSIAQDGYTSGRLSGLSVASDGTIQGRYSNGQTRDLAQVVLGNFNNPNGLTSLGNNQWAETADSGQPLIGVPGSGSLGVIQSAAIEESNVDLTAELVNMITYQRAYQANAQTIKTQDSILQTLVNLR
jgi:flagellar hook protein FlgE